jgi:hypothetical protein
MDHHEFLDRFGPAKNAAEAFGVSVICIGHWKTRGIPPLYWQKVIDIAREKDWSMTITDLVSKSPSKRVQHTQAREHAGHGQIR